MHELALAQDIIQIAEENAHQAEAEVIHELEIEIGDMSGVVEEALLFGFDVLKKGSMLENANIKVIRTKGMARCRKCGHTFKVDDFCAACPRCNTLGPEIIEGEEFKVKAIHVD